MHPCVFTLSILKESSGSPTRRLSFWNWDGWIEPNFLFSTPDGYKQRWKISSGLAHTENPSLCCNDASRKFHGFLCDRTLLNGERSRPSKLHTLIYGIRARIWSGEEKKLALKPQKPVTSLLIEMRFFIIFLSDSTSSALSLLIRWPCSRRKTKEKKAGRKKKTYYGRGKYPSHDSLPLLLQT